MCSDTDNTFHLPGENNPTDMVLDSVIKVANYGEVTMVKFSVFQLECIHAACERLALYQIYVCLCARACMQS